MCMGEMVTLGAMSCPKRFIRWRCGGRSPRRGVGTAPIPMQPPGSVLRNPNPWRNLLGPEAAALIEIRPVSLGDVVGVLAEVTFNWRLHVRSRVRNICNRCWPTYTPHCPFLPLQVGVAHFARELDLYYEEDYILHIDELRRPDQGTMAIGEDFVEPLINAEVSPPVITSTAVFTVAENYMAVTRPLSDGHGNNPVSHDPEEKGPSRWVWGEVREQCWLAGPIMGMYMLQYALVLTGSTFVGHLGSFTLAAYTLANAFCSITGFTVLAGLASALETLCGQAYGAKQYHLLGIYLQRAAVVLVTAAVPIGAIWVNMDRILVAVGEDPLIAEAARSYTMWVFPILIVYGIQVPLIKFFQAQRAVFQLMLCSAVTVLVHVPLCWLVIDKLNMGFKGAAMAGNISFFLNLSILWSFVRFSPRFEKTFSSFSWDAFRDLREFFRLAVPSATMVCLEHWSYEILTLLAGLLPNSNLSISSFAICMGLLAISNMAALALGVATSVRVSNELGAGKAHAARSVVAVSVVIGLVDGTVMASLIYLVRDIWGWGFSNDREVVEHVAHTAPYLAVLAILYACQAILSGVVRGIGWQRVGAIVNLGAYYAVGLPVALVSVFVFRFDGRGLWLGMGCGIVIQTVALLSIILCTNWDKLAQEALLRSLSFSSQLPTLAPPPLIKPLLEDGHSSKDLQPSVK